jgi:hypothetical protein
MATIAAESQQQVPVRFKVNPARGRQDMNLQAGHVVKGTPMGLNGTGRIPALGLRARGQPPGSGFHGSMACARRDRARTQLCGKIA